MNFGNWQSFPLDLDPLPFSTPVSDIRHLVVVEYDNDTVAAIEVVGRDHDSFRVRTRTTGGRGSRLLVIGESHTLSDVAIEAAESRPLRAFLVPRARDVVTAPSPRLRQMQWLGALSVVVMTLLISFFGPSEMAVSAGLIATVLIPGVMTLGHVWGSELISAWSHTVRTEVGNFPLESLPVRRLLAAAHPVDIDDVKEEYGRLLSDIIYRIERPALFDATVGPTRAFTAALLQWDSAGSSLTPAERSELAAKVRVTFDAARANAEAIGINHIPEESRESARRAAKALRLAASTRNEQERAAAQQQAVRILNSLALYYLPDPDETTTMLEGRRILALPGRRTTQETP